MLIRSLSHGVCNVNEKSTVASHKHPQSHWVKNVDNISKKCRFSESKTTVFKTVVQDGKACFGTEKPKDLFKLSTSEFRHDITKLVALANFSVATLNQLLCQSHSERNVIWCKGC